MAATQMSDQTIIRRSANYHPSIWDYDYVQSLRSKYAEEIYIKQVEKLKEEVRPMLGAVVDHLHQLELIDTLQRLGVSYHFEEDIKRILNTICNNKQNQESLHAVALEFRLLRQHGFDISAEIFSHFKDEKGIFKSCVRDDCQGMLDLYEAAYLLVEEEESMLHDIRNLTTTYLKEYVKHSKDDEYLSTLVNHALELPLEWRMPRLEARRFIDVYEKRQDMKPILLDFAKLDFNIVQAMHQEDVKHASSWWRNTGLAKKLSFARDRLVECFLWNVGTLFQPQFGYCRILVTKLMALISTIDDVYDVYGTLDELELFTDTIERWGVNAMEKLPHYMKICFLALHNSINEIAFDALKEQELHIIPYLKKEWADVCKALLLEARWYYSGYVPTLGEYIENALISIGGPMVLVHTYFFIRNPTRKEAFECLQEYHNIIRYASIITRLADDLGTSSEELKRGDVPKSIQCYMHETGVSEENAREHIRELITTTWMKMNKERAKNCHLPDAFNEFAMNAVKTAFCIYQHGDGYGIGEGETKARILSLLINPIL